MSTNKDFFTTIGFGSKSSSKKFLDPADYIYESYKEISDEDSKNFLDYRKNWNDSLKLKIFDFPLYIMTEQTFSCNFICPQCILGNSEEKKAFDPKIPLLPINLFKKIIDEGENHKCRSLSVHHINEPLLVKDLPERISYARKHGFLDIHMITNGQLLDEKKASDLIKSGITRIMISLDAFSKETYEKIRIGGDFDKVKENIINVVKIRNELGLKLPIIRTSFVLQKDNLHEVDEFKKYWSDIVDYVHIQAYQKPYETAEDFRTKTNSLPEGQFKCDQPFNRIVIRADGTVLPCCSFLAYELPMGNINNFSISEIWNSDEFKKMRTMHLNGNYKQNEVCKKCVENF